MVKFTPTEKRQLRQYHNLYCFGMPQRAAAKKIVRRSADPASDARPFFGRSFASIYNALRRLDGSIA